MRLLPHNSIVGRACSLAAAPAHRPSSPSPLFAWLQWAAEAGKADNLLLLIESGANPCYLGSKGRQPLHWAARNGHPEVAQALLSKGAEAAARDEDGATPLHLAGIAGQAALVPLLVEAGCPKDAGDQDGKCRGPSVTPVCLTGVFTQRHCGYTMTSVLT